MPGPAVAVKGELAALVAGSRPLTAFSARADLLVMARRRGSARERQREGQLLTGRSIRSVFSSQRVLGLLPRQGPESGRQAEP